ncbi:YbjN domain-containing protein [Brevundimonas sp.]|uniref:YbjN domain-containing protein n=1 Tax=Brevundimonas sp. TaxID=1871086 RepID=UPI002C05E7BE|nr:YbjN domain-containing protein [Brevundimonas sp.]HWQ86780.1 YbjN domain-containing protein [Brevundimonas sp.]
MRLPVLFAALALGAASPAFAQTPAPAPAAPVAATKGVVVADARTWLIGLGGSVAEPAAEGGAQTLTIADQPLPWTLTFYNCAGAGLCDDVQFSAVFSGPITAEQINAWNRDNRYLKAFFVPGATPETAGAVAQYDVVLTATGTEQLQEPTVIWLQMLRQFAQGLAQAAGPAAQ